MEEAVSGQWDRLDFDVSVQQSDTFLMIRRSEGKRFEYSTADQTLLNSPEYKAARRHRPAPSSTQSARRSGREYRMVISTSPASKSEASLFTDPLHPALRDLEAPMLSCPAASLSNLVPFSLMTCRYSARVRRNGRARACVFDEIPAAFDDDIYNPLLPIILN